MGRLSCTTGSCSTRARRSGDSAAVFAAQDEDGDLATVPRRAPLIPRVDRGAFADRLPERLLVDALYERDVHLVISPRSEPARVGALGGSGPSADRPRSASSRPPDPPRARFVGQHWRGWPDWRPVVVSSGGRLWACSRSGRRATTRASGRTCAHRRRSAARRCEREADDAIRHRGTPGSGRHGTQLASGSAARFRTKRTSGIRRSVRAWYSR